MGKKRNFEEEMVFGFLKNDKLHGYGKSNMKDEFTFGPERTSNTKGKLLEGFWVNGNMETETIKDAL